MTIRRTLANLVNSVLAPFGVALRKTKYDRSTMEHALQTIGRRSHDAQTVVDIGASDGRWSADLMRYLPTKKYLLVEAQPIHEPRLKVFCQAHPNAQFVLAAAGERQGSLFFDASDPFGGQASLTPFQDAIEVPVTTIDHEVQTRSLSGPFILKFDTHGFELAILRGAVETLRATDVVVMECYNFQIAPECLLFFEMCEHLRGLGFRPVDLVDPMHRPYDDSFWQMDIVFVREDRPEFRHPGFR